MRLCDCLMTASFENLVVLIRYMKSFFILGIWSQKWSHISGKSTLFCNTKMQVLVKMYHSNYLFSPPFCALQGSVLGIWAQWTRQILIPMGFWLANISTAFLWEINKISFPPLNIRKKRISFFTQQRKMLAPIIHLQRSQAPQGNPLSLTFKEFLSDRQNTQETLFNMRIWKKNTGDFNV